MVYPPLSSVRQATDRIGYEIGRVLEERMSGNPVSDEPCLIPPIGITVRQSSDVWAIADPDILEAMRFIRDHAQDGISVSDILQAVPMDRRRLERQFRKRLGRTPLAEILRTRLDRAKQLLVDSHLQIPEVANRSGFGDPDRFAQTFRKKVGMPPSVYRQQFCAMPFRLGGGSGRSMGV